MSDVGVFWVGLGIGILGGSVAMWLAATLIAKKTEREVRKLLKQHGVSLLKWDALRDLERH